MALTKEQILTLTCLKEVGIKGIGPQKIFVIARRIEDKAIEICSVEDLATLMAGMEEKAIKKVTLQDLNEAFRYAKRIIEASEAQNIGYIGYYDDEFPPILRHVINEKGKEEPPLILWYRGNLSAIKRPGLAIIGTREATPEGIAGGEHLSREFAKRGFNIVSGLAVGCDTSGHTGALNGGGLTTAILANGLDHNSIYPPENQDLAEKIVAKGGLLLSEYRIGLVVNRYNLVARDRLQAGLSLATLVVQTGEHGGTMHAATATLKANKPLFVIQYKDPATNEHEKCRGNALLARKGAEYISGRTNIDELCKYIINHKSSQTDIFD